MGIPCQELNVKSLLDIFRNQLTYKLINLNSGILITLWTVQSYLNKINQVVSPTSAKYEW